MLYTVQRVYRGLLPNASLEKKQDIYVQEFNKIFQLLRFHENIIIIRDPSETYRRPIGYLLETYRRPTYLIGDPWVTDMPDRRPIEDLDMLHWRPI